MLIHDLESNKYSENTENILGIFSKTAKDISNQSSKKPERIAALRDVILEKSRNVTNFTSKEGFSNMTLEIINELFSVCKVTDFEGLDLSSPFVFIASTDEEKSLVCPHRYVPENTVDRDDGWKAFRIEGTLDFSLIGILADISNVLAEGEVGLFAISTFNTDYILTKSDSFEHAIGLLQSAGYSIK